MTSIRKAWRLTLVALLILIILFTVTVLFPIAGNAGRGRLTRTLAKFSMWVMGIRVRVTGTVPDASAAAIGWASEGPGYMVCSNHVTFVDIFALSCVLPVRFVAKKEIASWPVFGLISKRTGTIFIDRTRRRAVLEIAEAMTNAMKEGRNVLFFPEGTTGTGEGLLPFHANLFASAVAAEAPILPVTLRYTKDGAVTTLVSYAHRDLFTVLKDICATPGLAVDIQVLPVIEAAGRERRDICAEASRVMSAALGVEDATAALEAKRLARAAAAERKEEVKEEAPAAQA
ncbi:MAG: 1-acyl-sn-glycerol-3-phosphate acyltransferase [Sutterella parvirubra]|uniref:1-acyl-sn-glycerol-3-phosphate acyltransferase n=1 Tax=Sutterella parvirubra YIT 11816 TaxID=762967 RepID=H3KGW4_9BURK|nr:lysophospholipid acyltransferase family protein [Sutterella parvirubra]EHY30645.1 Acyltransferase [Sutterella parvirubra YIT 11816]MCI7708697.1 1-acyl-sn-glycerol-3-phosphate acyltransferase [Sutterella parvirubra]MDR3770786.1 lysophospholipid acyltransferase family protein [Sutterella sp.]